MLWDILVAIDLAIRDHGKHCSYCSMAMTLSEMRSSLADRLRQTPIRIGRRKDGTEHRIAIEAELAVRSRRSRGI
jgi:hypothetical protein